MNNHSTNKNNNPAGKLMQGVQVITMNALGYVLAYSLVLIFVLTTAYFAYILPATITLIIMHITFLIGGVAIGFDNTYGLLFISALCIAIAYPVFIVAKLKCMQAYCALKRGEE